MTYLLEALEERFLDEPDVFIGGNLLLFYEQGVRDAVVAPAAFVAKGLPDGKALRRKYLLWEERRLPCFVAEVTSETTRKNDERDGTTSSLTPRGTALDRHHYWSDLSLQRGGGCERRFAKWSRRLREGA